MGKLSTLQVLEPAVSASVTSIPALHLLVSVQQNLWGEVQRKGPNGWLNGPGWGGSLEESTSPSSDLGSGPAITAPTSPKCPSWRHSSESLALSSTQPPHFAHLSLYKPSIGWALYLLVFICQDSSNTNLFHLNEKIILRQPRHSC